MSSGDFCSCGIPWRDYDNRCLRCKNQIQESRANSLSFHRQITDIQDCKCSDNSRSNWGSRPTEIEGLYFCNFCDLKLTTDISDYETRTAKAQKALQREAEDAHKNRIRDEVLRLENLLRGGATINLHKTLYVSVDSYTEVSGKIITFNSYDDLEVKKAGIEGWRVVTSIPRTAGGALENYEGFSKVWAGGIGGSVVGVYVLMEYQVGPHNLNQSLNKIEEAVRECVR